MSQVIADRFDVERVVGAGGMGEVFRARDRLTGGLVAVKVLHAAMRRDEERFRREAQLLAEIHHPRIVRYVAHGIAPGGRPYIAMEWLDGEDLAEVLARRGLSVHESLSMVRRAAEALGALHERGIVHRDVKPSNLFLVGGKPEQVKLLDLGVARFIDSTRPSTRTGVMVGTPGYMAPEQARGARELDARVDVFALGCVLFECLAGRPVFVGDNVAALLAKILLEEAPSLQEFGVEVPPALDELVRRMLAKHPASRPADGKVVASELERLTAVKDAPPNRASTHLRALTGTERRFVSVIIASALVLDDAAPPSAHETAAASFDPKAIAAGFGAEAELLADGSVVVTLSGKGGGDQAAHAARCALSLRTFLPGTRLALASGLATVANGRPLVGDVIERAAAILATARAIRVEVGEETQNGESPVFLDETTAGLLDTRFDVGGDDRGLFIRGLRERDVAPRTLLGKVTPFVGRERELSTLMGIYDECVGESVARVALVTGFPGAGKSRAVAEFVRRLRERGPAEIWSARGDVISEGSPFGLLARLLRRAAGITGGEPLGVRRQKLRARIGRHVPEVDVARVAEFTGEIASIHFVDTESVQLRAARKDAMLMGDQMRRAFTDLVLAEATAAPFVVLLEDLHWGDLPSINFLDGALRAAGDRPLFVLGVARSEVHEAFPSLWQQRSMQEIRLGPLVRRAGERLVRDVLGSVSDDEVARLLDRAAGNVFYLEELIRAFAEGTGRAASRSSTAPPPLASEMSVDAAPWSLPGTVLAMIEARFERLDPMARRLLRAASIFGEVFWRGGVLALAGGTCKAVEVDDWLGELVRREIVQKRDVSRFPGEREFVFRHALVRDAAYHMLTTEDRALGHKLAGEWLEGQVEHEPMVLGEHFERGGVAERAAAFYATAAAQALEGNDLAAARARADRAIQAGARGTSLGKLRLLLAEASRWAGEHEVALWNARAAMRELEHGSDPWHGAAAEAVDASMVLGHVEQAVTVARSVKELDAIAGRRVPSARVVAMARMAVRLLTAGAFDLSSAMIDAIERDAPDVLATDPSARAFTLAARVVRARWLGDTEEAALLAQEAVTCFELLGDVRNAALHRDAAGFALVQLGAFTDAENMLTEVIEVADRLGLAALSNEGRLHLSQVFTRLHRKDEAVRNIQEVIGGFAVQGDRAGEGRARAYLAGVWHLAGDGQAAEEEALRAMDLLERSPPYRAGLFGLLAVVRADRGAARLAHEAGTEGMRLLESLGGTLEAEALVRVGYAEGLRAIGDVDGSRRAITEARDRLLARASRIQNPEWRRGFVERFQEHARIFARAGQWLV